VCRRQAIGIPPRHAERAASFAKNSIANAARGSKLADSKIAIALHRRPSSFFFRFWIWILGSAPLLLFLVLRRLFRPVGNAHELILGITIRAPLSDA
jgi:hypothetical protein